MVLLLAAPAFTSGSFALKSGSFTSGTFRKPGARRFRRAHNSQRAFKEGASRPSAHISHQSSALASPLRMECNRGAFGSDVGRLTCGMLTLGTLRLGSEGPGPQARGDAQSIAGLT